MKDKGMRISLLGAALALSVAGFFLRRHHLAVGVDASGLPNGKGVVALMILCVAAVVLSIVAPCLSKKRSPVAAGFPADKISLVGYFAAGGFTALAGVVGLVNPSAVSMNGTMISRLASAVGVAAGFSMVAMGVGQYRKKTPAALPWMMPVVYYILQLLLRFRGWSIDPMVMDYAFKLFSFLGAMLSACFMAGFAVEEGKGRTALCFSILGIVFSAITLAEGGLGSILLHGASLLFCLCNAWQILGKTE